MAGGSLRMLYVRVLSNKQVLTKMAKKAAAKSQANLVEVLHALADPVRLEIVRQLDAEGEKACGLFGIDMPKSSLSHHFRVLRESGVIATEGQGTVLMNRLQRKELEARFPGLLESVLSANRRRK
jgi:DNA-binding transcriptional ArsR family regulator